MKFSLTALLATAFALTCVANDLITSGTWRVLESQNLAESPPEIAESAGRNTLVLESGQRAFLQHNVPDDFTLELDISGTGMPGIGFRAQDPFNYDYVFFRTRGADSPDHAIQYLPVFNGAVAWHLYAHFQAAAHLEPDKWFRATLEVKGDLCRVSIDGQLHQVVHLDRDRPRTGSLFLRASTGSVRFANLQVGPVQPFQPSPAPEPPAHALTQWEVSPLANLTPMSPPGAIGRERARLKREPWTKIEADRHGLINLAKLFDHPRAGVFARTTITAENAREAVLKFDYTHWLTISLNGEIIFSGRELDTHNFFRVVDGEQSLPLALRTGDNSVEFLIFGYDLSHNPPVLGRHQYDNWGFIARIEEPAIFAPDR